MPTYLDAAANGSPVWRPIRTQIAASSGQFRRREGSLGFGGGCYRLLSARERDEKRVALVVDLIAVVANERVAQQPPMQIKRLGVALRPEPLE